MEVEVDDVAHFLAAAINPPVVPVKRQLPAKPAAQARQRAATMPHRTLNPKSCNARQALRFHGTVWCGCGCVCCDTTFAAEQMPGFPAVQAFEPEPLLQQVYVLFATTQLHHSNICIEDSDFVTPELVWPSSEAQQARVSALPAVQPLPCKHMLPRHLIHACTAAQLSSQHTYPPGQCTQ